MRAFILIFAFLALVFSASAYDAVCNGRGIFNNKRCQCHPDFVGSRCQTRICNRGASMEVSCNVQGGICDTISYPARCACRPGFSGNDCSTRSALNLPAPFNGALKGSVKMAPFAVDGKDVKCQKSENATAFTPNFNGNGEGTTITLNVEAVPESKTLNTTAFPAHKIVLTNVNITGTIISGVATVTAGELTILDKVNAQGSLGNNQVTINLFNPTVPPGASPVFTCDTAAKTGNVQFTLDTTPPAPSSSSSISASVFVVLSILASVLAFL